MPQSVHDSPGLSYTTTGIGARKRRPKESRPGRGGFTLIELMIVVAIIAIIAAVAIPSFLNARIAGNESSAISTMRTLVTVSEQYRTRFGSYASGLADLWAEGYIDSSVADPFKAGYTFTYAGAGTSYTFNGDPTNPGQSGHRYFYTDTSGVIRFSTTGTATSADPAVGDS